MNDSRSSADNSGHFHAVRFYENTAALSRIVVEFLGEGLTLGEAALLIATAEHRGIIETELEARGFDLNRLKVQGDLVVLDANETLDRFMHDGVPQSALFRSTMMPLLERAAAGKTRAIRAYGEMVDVLWRAGHTVAAVKLEMLWNELARTHDFSLLCGYAMGNFYKSASVDEICEQHSHVVSAHGEYGRVI